MNIHLQLFLHCVCIAYLHANKNNKSAIMIHSLAATVRVLMIAHAPYDFNASRGGGLIGHFQSAGSMASLDDLDRPDRSINGRSTYKQYGSFFVFLMHRLPRREIRNMWGGV